MENCVHMPYFCVCLKKHGYSVTEATENFACGKTETVYFSTVFPYNRIKSKGKGEKPCSV